VGELSWHHISNLSSGLFVAVQGLENLGIIGYESAGLPSMRQGSTEKFLAAAGTTAFASEHHEQSSGALIARRRAVALACALWARSWPR